MAGASGIRGPRSGGTHEALAQRQQAGPPISTHDPASPSTQIAKPTAGCPDPDEGAERVTRQDRRDALANLGVVQFAYLRELPNRRAPCGDRYSSHAIRGSSKCCGRLLVARLGDDNKIMAASELMTTKQSCLDAITTVKAEAHNAPVVDMTHETQERGAL